jgi:hypothetical protein
MADLAALVTFLISVALYIFLAIILVSIQRHTRDSARAQEESLRLLREYLNEMRARSRASSSPPPLPPA